MRASGAVAIASVCLCLAAPARAQERYSPRNGVFNLKALIFGGGFRVTTAIPLHGDFSRFDRVQIVEAQSLIGKDAPVGFLRRLTKQLADEFRRGGRFRRVAIIEGYRPPDVVALDGDRDQDAYRTADPLDAPMRGPEDMVAMDRLRASAQRRDSADTLVVKSQVIDYTKGNRWLQLLFLNWGNSVVTLRFSFLDRETGEELGRSVVSSDNSSNVMPGLLNTRSLLAGVAEGVVDQVTRRKVGAER